MTNIQRERMRAENRAGIVLAVVSAVIFFDALHLSITQIALPDMQVSLHVATSTLPWIAAAYVVTYGGFLLFGGRASDLLGSRPVFLAGLAVFGIASLACGLAGSAAVLIGARAVQGIGAALTVPAAIAILATTFTDERARTRAFGIFAAAAASGFSAGLVFGGLITSGLFWRWIFLAKVPAVGIWLVIVATLLSFGLGMGLAYPAATLGGVHGVEPADQGTAAGLNNTALQLGGGLGLAIVATAVMAGLQGNPPDTVAPELGLHAARWGAVAATVLPLIGALIVLVGMRDRGQRAR